MNELISVIIPVYNCKQYLDECVQSVLHQAYSKLEIILVDDGSTDESGEICDKYAMNYENVFVFHNTTFFSPFLYYFILWTSFYAVLVV